MLSFVVLYMLFLILGAILLYTLLSRVLVIPLHKPIGKAKVYEFWASKTAIDGYYYVIYRKPGDWFGKRIMEYSNFSRSLVPLMLNYDVANKKMKHWANNLSEFKAHQKQCLELVAANKPKYKKIVYKS